jgi:small subunit ribosomal protein S18
MINDRKKSMNDESEQEDYLKISLVNQGIFMRRRRSCPLKNVLEEEINYKNLKLLNRYITDRGKIVPSRVSGVSAKKQRALAKAIKRARNLALLSFVSKIENNNN